MSSFGGFVAGVLERLGIRQAPDPARTPAPATQPPGPGAFVVLDLDYEGGLLHLVLANTGTAAALDVSVTFDRPVVGLGGELDLATLPLFRGLPVLRPGRELRVFCEAGPAIAAIGRFRADVRWTAIDGSAHRARFDHDTMRYRLWPEVISGAPDGP